MRRSLFTTLATALLILLAAGVMACGQTLAPGDDTKKAIAAADKKAATSGATIQQLAKALVQHVATLADVNRQFDAIRERQRNAAPLIARALEAANASLAAAKEDAAAAQKALRDAEAELAAAKTDLGPKRAAIERAASDQRRAFEASDEFKQASAKVEAANAGLVKQRSRLDAAMKTDPKLGPLATTVAKAEGELNAARSKSPPDNAAIAEASAKLIEAKNALSAAQAEAWSADAAFTAARKAADAAAAARQALSDAFGKSILTQPGVADAQLAFHDAQDRVKLAQANVDAAKDAFARTGRWLIAQRASADAIAQIAFDADRAIVEARTDLKRAEDAARDIAADLAKAAATVLSIRDDLKAIK